MKLSSLLTIGLLAGGLVAPPGLAEPHRSPGRSPEPLQVVLTFSHMPDSRGRFEVELFVEATRSLANVSLAIVPQGPVRFADELPRFEGPMEAGEQRSWRFRGRRGPSRGFPPTVAAVAEVELPAGSLPPTPFGGLLGLDPTLVREAMVTRGLLPAEDGEPVVTSVSRSLVIARVRRPEGR